MKNTGRYALENNDFLSRALAWASAHSHMAYLNHHGIAYPYQPFPHLLAVGCRRQVVVPHPATANALALLQQSHHERPSWLLGYLGYDLKNQLERLESQNTDLLGTPDLYFFEPEHLLFFSPGQVTIHSNSRPAQLYRHIAGHAPLATPPLPQVTLASDTTRQQYIDAVERIRQHIIDGDVYELNYCMAMHAAATLPNPLALHQQLCARSPMPFAAYLQLDGLHLLSASPERYLKKSEHTLVSQPIKGTIRRGTTPTEDEKLKFTLRYSEKEMAENMMIVDLVRNDLARCATTGSVTVNELFGIYSYRQVHQMVSTVSGRQRPGTTLADVLRATYPMGSMTGAPKVKVMELIERYERSRRGLFSGAAGYITPQGDFDLNVVIRSLMYQARQQKLAFHVGSAITYDSVPEQEYDECLLKASAITSLLGQPQATAEY